MLLFLQLFVWRMQPNCLRFNKILKIISTDGFKRNTNRKTDKSKENRGPMRMRVPLHVYLCVHVHVIRWCKLKKEKKEEQGRAERQRC